MVIKYSYRALFADEKEIPYWLADETLLGWHWGKKRLFWDNSISIQVPYKVLYELEQYSGRVIHKQYEFVLNPNFKFREYQANYEIDAFYTDLDTGFFIEIKGLAQENHNRLEHKLHSKVPQFYHYNSVFPLYRTTFEGVPTWRPNNHTEILESQYGRQAINSKIFDVSLVSND